MCMRFEYIMYTYLHISRCITVHLVFVCVCVCIFCVLVYNNNHRAPRDSPMLACGSLN